MPFSTPRFSVQITSYGQRQQCRIAFRNPPKDTWLKAFLSRCDSHPTETIHEPSAVILFRDNFRSQFVDLVNSAANCATELVKLELV